MGLYSELAIEFIMPFFLIFGYASPMYYHMNFLVNSSTSQLVNKSTRQPLTYTHFILNHP